LNFIKNIDTLLPGKTQDKMAAMLARVLHLHSAWDLVDNAEAVGEVIPITASNCRTINMEQL